MNTLNKAIVKDTETSTEHGFSWIVFVVDNEEYTLQACVDDNGLIDKDDDGMDWGLCLDANEKAFKKFGQEECLSFFYSNTDADIA